MSNINLIPGTAIRVLAAYGEVVLAATIAAAVIVAMSA